MILAMGLLGLVLSANSVAADEQSLWIGSWASSPAGVPSETTLGSYRYPTPVTVQGTIRYRLRLSQGGRALRLRLTNEYADKALKLGAVTVGLAGEGLHAVPGTLRRATFLDRGSIEIPAGAAALTDRIELAVGSLSDLVVSIHAPDGIATYSCTSDYTPTDQTVAVGVDATMQPNLPKEKCLSALRPLVSAVNVLVDEPRKVVVALGDSITDGSVDPETGDRGWPGALARRLHSKGISVVNAGIGGNRLLKNYSIAGASALTRLERDVFSVPGLSHIILLEGINDIGMSAGMMGDHAPLVDAEDLIGAYSQIVTRAHERRIKVLCATVTPFEGTPYAGYYSDKKELVREQLNAWVKTAKSCDGVIDFDAALRDPETPLRLKKEYDSGDHLHPSHAGLRRMGAAVDVNLFN